MQSSVHIRMITISLCLTVLLFARSAHAATVHVTILPEQPGVGQSFDIGVYLRTDTDSINAAEGTFSLSPALAIDSVRTGDSAFSLWPVLPVYSRTSNSVSFAGGTTEALTPGRDALLFVITAHTAAAGEYAMTSNKLTAYRADGTGAAISLRTEKMQWRVATQATTALDEPRDVVAPQFVASGVGQDPSLFGGKYFATFFATDAGGGVARYEVREGLFGSYTPAHTYYVLRDQSGRTPIWIKASDAAGNVTVLEIPAPHPKTRSLWGPACFLLVLVAFVIFLRR